MNITEPIITEIDENTYLINEFGLDVCYLIIGSEHALLIDTGTGVCDLKEIVKLITDLPLTVALTHGHFDHAGGIGQFDSVYVHKNDKAFAQSITVKIRKNYVASMLDVIRDRFQMLPNEVREFENMPQMIAFGDSNVWSLGARDVESVLIPGHTWGSVVFIDDATGILFAGDACTDYLMLAFPGIDTLEEPRMTTSVATALKGIEKLKLYSARFNRIFTGHTCYGTNINVISKPVSLIDDQIACLTGILSGELEREDMPSSINRGHLKRSTFGDSSVVFDDRYLIEEPVVEEPYDIL